MAVQIEDPLSIPDVMSEVRWHPETEDFVKGLGRWVESEDDLEGMQPQNDATMSDQFNDLGDAFDGGNASAKAGQGDDEGSTETAGMDAEFE